MTKLCRKGLHLVDYSIHKQCPNCKKVSKARFAGSEKGKEMKRLEHQRHKSVRNLKNNEACKKRMLDPQYKLKENSRKSQYKKNNPDKVSFYESRRRATKLQAQPKWLSKDQQNEIKAIYKLRDELQWLNDPSDPLTVDHIIPLQGELVSGLHVLWNLQILPRSKNCSKSNKFEEL